MTSKSKNMHYLYNVDYFEPLKTRKLDNIKSADFSEKNKAIYDFSYNGISVKDLDCLSDLPGYKKRSLYTSYPGLVIGFGNSHDVAADDAISGGFSFDHVTGLPIIPGSTLKGILRSYFPESGKKNLGERKELIEQILDKRIVDMKDLVSDIFDHGDIFVGGFPLPNSDGKILSDDYITPHKEPLKNPNPIHILKVKPNVKYEFIFILKDSIISADEKLELFTCLLELGGIGAKTNVGFGQLGNAYNFEIREKRLYIKKEDFSKNDNKKNSNKKNNTVLIKDKEYKGKVTYFKGDNLAFFTITEDPVKGYKSAINRIGCGINKKRPITNKLEEGKEYTFIYQGKFTVNGSEKDSWKLKR